MPCTHFAHDGDLLQELLVLAGIILQLLEDLDSNLLTTVVAAVQIAEAASSHLLAVHKQQHGLVEYLHSKKVQSGDITSYKVLVH